MASFEKYAEKFFESVEKLYVAIPGVEDGFGKDFLQIKKKADELKQDPTFACKAGQADENRKKNRYKDILPFDFARVKFTNYHGGSDYINASYIKRGKDEHCYIAAQGPLPHTVNDFWNMVWCCKVKVIVMVCKEIEMGRRKCERYWADEEERCKTFGEFTIEFSSSRQDNKDFLVRNLVVKFRNEKRTVVQFHYTAWPDHGVPKARASILQMIMEARREQSYETDTKQPLCIHCSAGCGRTGAVLVIDYFRHLLSIDRLEGTVFNVVMEMRRQRSSVVQTKEQYEFVHLAVGELLTNHIKDKNLNCLENSVSRSISNAHNYVNVQIQPDRKHTSLAPMKPTSTPEVKPRSSQYYGAAHLKSPSDIPPGKPSRNPADSRTAPGSRVTSFDSADGKSRPAVYSKSQQNKIPPPKPSLVKRASSDSGPIHGTPSMMSQQKSSTFGYMNRGGYNKNADNKYGKDSSQAVASSKPPMVGKVQLPALQEKFNIQTQQQNMATGGDRSHHHHHHHHARFVSASVLDLSEKSSQKQQHPHQQSTARMASASVQDLRSVETHHHHPKSTERNGSHHPFQQPASNQTKATTPTSGGGGGKSSYADSFLASKNTDSKPDTANKTSGRSYTNGAYAAVTVKSPPPAVKPKPKPSVRRKPPAANKSESTPSSPTTTSAPAASVQQQGKPLRFVNNLPAIRKQHFKTTSTCSDKEVRRVALPRNHHPTTETMSAATATSNITTTTTTTAALRRALKPETATPVTLSPPTPARRTHITPSPNQQQPKAPVRYSNIIESLTTPTTSQHQRPFSHIYPPPTSSSKPAASTHVSSSKNRDSTVATVMTAAEKTSAAASNPLPTSKKPQPVKPKRSVRAASSTTYAALQHQQQRPVPEARRRRSHQQQHDTSSNNGWNSMDNQHQHGSRPTSSTFDYSNIDAPHESSFLTPATSQHHLLQPHNAAYGNNGGRSGGTRSVSDKPTEYETVTLDLPPKLPERTPESYRVVSEDEDDGDLDTSSAATGGGGQIGRYESLHVKPATSPARSQPSTLPSQQDSSSIYATVTDVAPPLPQSAPPLPVSSAPTPSVSTGSSLIPTNVTAPFKEFASKFKNLAPSSLTGAHTADSQSKSMANLAKFTSPNVTTSIGADQDMNFGNRYRRKPVGPRKQPEQWSSSKLL